MESAGFGFALAVPVLSCRHWLKDLKKEGHDEHVIDLTYYTFLILEGAAAFCSNCFYYSCLWIAFSVSGLFLYRFAFDIDYKTSCNGAFWSDCCLAGSCTSARPTSRGCCPDFLLISLSLVVHQCSRQVFTVSVIKRRKAMVEESKVASWLSGIHKG